MRRALDSLFFLGPLSVRMSYSQMYEVPMSRSLSAIEGERSRLLEDISQLGDLRSGSITGVVRRCGKPNCYCAQPGDPGHGAKFRLT